MSNFPTDRSKAVPLLQYFFVCASSGVSFAVISPFDASGRLCFVIVAFFIM